MLRAIVRYIARETLISAVINIAISCAFFYLQFGSSASVSWRGHGGLVRDAVPQTFAVALMSVLVPTLITRNRGLRGALPVMVKHRAITPAKLIIRAFGAAVIAAFCGFIATSVVFGQEVSDISFRSALAFKCGYDGLVALIVTPMALWIALRGAQPPAAASSSDL